MVQPANGVYQTTCKYNGKEYRSITNVGVKPTIGEYEKNIETNIFDFDNDIYGCDIEVRFLDRIREEKKFSGIEELKKQIEKDCVTAERMHSGEM
jgi:riboflavin kinase/FMN adenylyltransferase